MSTIVIVAVIAGAFLVAAWNVPHATDAQVNQWLRDWVRRGR
jgi:hypothetical protein